MSGDPCLSSQFGSNQVLLWLKQGFGMANSEKSILVDYQLNKEREGPLRGTSQALSAIKGCNC